MRLYIAGPMTNMPNLNYPSFNATAERLAHRGHEVYNPATTFNGAYLDLPYDIWLREAIRLVSMVNGIVLLPGWYRSKGALTEIHIGLSLGMPFYEEYDGNIYQMEMDHRLLIDAMDKYYLGGKRATEDGVSKGIGGNPRQAEGRENHNHGSTALPAPGVEAALVR